MSVVTSIKERNTIASSKRQPRAGQIPIQQGICAILQEISLPSVRITPITAEVLEHNELFLSLVQPVSFRNFRHWFVEGVLPHFAPSARSRWEAAFNGNTSFH